MPLDGQRLDQTQWLSVTETLCRVLNVLNVQDLLVKALRVPSKFRLPAQSPLLLVVWTKWLSPCVWSSFARVRNGSLAHFPVCQLSVLNFLNFLLINYGLLRIASLERHGLFWSLSCHWCLSGGFYSTSFTSFASSAELRLSYWVSTQLLHQWNPPANTISKPSLLNLHKSLE